MGEPPEKHMAFTVWMSNVFIKRWNNFFIYLFSILSLIIPKR